LLRNYLNKDHAWRHKLVDVPRRALIGDRRGDAFGEGSAATAYRNFEPLVGPGNSLIANVSDVSPPEVRWAPMLEADSYLWAYGCGGGAPDGISEMGTNGLYNDLYSTDVIDEDLKAVFVMLFGSWFGEWDVPDNLMRAFLATPSLGLACFISGRPQWFVHHMGLGETIGYSTRLTMNNDTLYQSQSNLFTRAIYVSLMGDPTLRLDRVSPPAALSATADSTGVVLNWAPSAESVLGYHVYRRSSPSEAFIRLTDELCTDLSFTDTDPLSGATTYMVRAVTLQTTASGTYFNASQGVFATIGVAPIWLLAQLSSDGLTLTWNAQPGAVYHVLASADLNPDSWMDVSGEVTSTEADASWTDVSTGLCSQRFYRIKQD
jgi:hypothetical protein